jgi:hypothetical protein
LPIDPQNVAALRLPATCPIAALKPVLALKFAALKVVATPPVMVRVAMLPANALRAVVALRLAALTNPETSRFAPVPPVKLRVAMLPANALRAVVALKLAALIRPAATLMLAGFHVLAMVTFVPLIVGA